MIAVLGNFSRSTKDFIHRGFSLKQIIKTRPVTYVAWILVSYQVRYGNSIRIGYDTGPYMKYLVTEIVTVSLFWMFA